MAEERVTLVDIHGAYAGQEREYTKTAAENAIAVFARDPGNGTLTFSQVVRDGVGGVQGLAGVSALAVSQDGGLGFHVYASGVAESSIVAFRRDASDLGRLTFVSLERDGFSGVNGLAGASGVAITADGRWVIGAGTVDDALAVRHAEAKLLRRLLVIHDLQQLLRRERRAVSVLGERVFVLALRHDPEQRDVVRDLPVEV